MRDMVTTLRAVRAEHPCIAGWEKLLRHLGKSGEDDEQLYISTVLENNGLFDALWCMRALPDECDDEVRQLACALATTVLQHAAKGDKRPHLAVETAERFAARNASKVELSKASNAYDVADIGEVPGYVSVAAACTAAPRARRMIYDVAIAVAGASKAVADGTGAEANAWDASIAAQTEIVRQFLAT